MTVKLFENVNQDPLLQLLLQLALTLALTRALGKLFGFMKQPLVIGEIIAGILMGPSVLGRIPGFTSVVWPTHTPLPPTGQPYDSTITFTVVADLGVVLFMFILGCEMDQHRLKQQWRQSLPIALSAIAFPFGVGAAASVWLEEVNKEGQPADWQPPMYKSFMLFLGASMSFTAFPVLASVLTTMGLLQAPIGVQALSCAAVDDVTAWCVLALASSFAQSASAIMGLYTCIGAIAYVIVMLLILRPMLHWLHNYLARRCPDINDNRYYTCGIYLLLMASAFTTQGLGIHCFFGGFVMGLIVPKQGGFAAGLAASMEMVVVELLLPLFFVSSGIKTNLGTLDTARYWGIVLAIFLIATGAKFTPATLVSKMLLRQRDWRFCTAIGILMNTRGLVELIALNIGLSMGILSPRLFTMMVMMAIGTTWATGPAIWLLYRGRHEELRGEQLTPVAQAAQLAAAADPDAAAGEAAAEAPSRVGSRRQQAPSVVFLYNQHDRTSSGGGGRSSSSWKGEQDLLPQPLAAAGVPGPSNAAAAAAAAGAAMDHGKDTV